MTLSLRFRTPMVAVTATALAFAALPEYGLAAQVKPVMSAAATLLGAVDFRSAVTSLSNRQAGAALMSAKPMLQLPRLLPGGHATLSTSSLAGMPATTDVIAASGLMSESGFTGIYEGANAAATGSELEPPDQGLAVYNGIVGEIVNNTVQFFKDGQALTAPLNNAVFFRSGTLAQLSDPHITFDPSVERWFADELTYSGPLGYGFFLAVSATSDPTGIWHVYFIPSASSDLKGCGKAGCLPDFPQVGYDASGFYITADLFGPVRFVGAAVYALPKAELVESRSVTPIRFVLDDFVVQPAVPAPGEPFSLANSGTEYFMTARNIYNGSTKIRLWSIENTFNIVSDPSTLIAVSTDFDAEHYGPTVPSRQPDQLGPYGKSQQALSSPRLDGGYNSFTANVKIARGLLYAALTTGAADKNGLPRDDIAYFVVDPNSSHLVKQGYIVPPTGYSISYPGLALDRNGNGFIGVTITNPDKSVVGGYPSAAIIPFAEKTGPGKIMVTGQGGATDDGFTGYGPPKHSGGVGRWGDFASAVIDAKGGAFYTANEFIPNPAIYPRGTFANWGTFITRIAK